MYGIIQNKKGYPGARRYKEKTAGKKSKRKDCREDEENGDSSA